MFFGIRQQKRIYLFARYDVTELRRRSVLSVYLLVYIYVGGSSIIFIIHCHP